MTNFMNDDANQRVLNSPGIGSPFLVDFYRALFIIWRRTRAGARSVALDFLLRQFRATTIKGNHRVFHAARVPGVY